MKTIYVQPLGGLCNRMRVIVGAASLAKKLHRKMVVIWTPDPSLNARFSDLFEPIPYRVIETQLASLTQKLRWHWLKDIKRYAILDDAWISQIARGKDFGLWEKLVADKDLFINSNLDILFDGDYSIFKAKQSLLQELNNIEIDHHTIGLHLRRTDSGKSIKYSPTHLFLDKVNEEIKKNPDVKFYLATDDPKEEQTFLEEFGDRILIYKKHSLDRSNSLAIKDAVVDLYNLSHCQKIYGSYWSSFSDTAALWTGIKKIELKIN